MLPLERIIDGIHRLVIPFKDIFTTVAILTTAEGVMGMFSGSKKIPWDLTIFRKTKYFSVVSKS